MPIHLEGTLSGELIMEEYPVKWINESLAVGYAPRSFDQLQSLQNAGIGSIVNLCAECYDLHDIEKQANFEVYYLPLADETAPNLEQIDSTIVWINTQIEARNRVLVHCRYGIGRTGTVVMAYLLHSGMSFDRAEEMMEHTPSRLSTNEQRYLIDSYIEKLQDGAGHTIGIPKNSNSLGRFFRRLEAIVKWND